MRLLKIATMVAPLFLRGQPKRASGVILQIIIASFLAVTGIIALLIAGFIAILKLTSIDIAFLCLAAVLLIPSAFIFLRLSFKPQKVRAVVAREAPTDPLIQRLPSSITENATVKPVIDYVNQHPIAATAAALTAGVFLANEFFGD